MQAELRAHLEGLGIQSEPMSRLGRSIRGRQHDDRLLIRQLVGLKVDLGAIRAVDVWRIVCKGKDISTTEDELTCYTDLPHGLTLARIPILTRTARETGAGTRKQSGFEWHAFSWGKLPLVADRLRADKPLQERLARLLASDIPGDLRIRAFPNERVGISIHYEAHHLPTREVLACFQDIFRHVREYVTERNRAREEEWPR